LHLQELQAQQAEEEQQLEMALRRSLEPQAPPPAPERPRNSLAHIEQALPAMPFSDAAGFLLVDDDDASANAQQLQDEGRAAHECAVCLAELQPEDKVRVLPCVHVFHQACVDKWLARSAACPTCKGSVSLR
jgi:hypothetical protein